ncbi:monosaccharide ABC transporter ATP-binding protein (CUT2 family) [Plasticicumulans lactativorans]|uniref:Monosaccharide ABC transporter ATP-binding protein (CUT2 family) n=1 Tax=Plasticicumulans lactativorans TaxID=1133106 RepID=A0A4V2SDC3_9GAMM|nr:sugar ABC transporter ATP-binding protein [Plasticicumulans lactativorans]TCO82813.1 monosaccharide ABC transporter ATP-binding protein (CUT2 family) [Plasticicumulans lactativorans]
MTTSTQQQTSSRTPVLQMENIAKRFGAHLALKGVSLELYAGEVHSLMGENGAGKSTLMKILAGAYQSDGGTIRIDGAEFVVDGPQAALEAGITLIYQEINLAPNLTVAENVFLGREPVRGGMVDRALMSREVGAVLKSLDATFGPETRVGDLIIADQQLVEIARALHRKSRILVMDEPTAALSARETERLFALIDGLKAQGLAIVYISHRMEEIYRLSDRVSVLRDGAYIGTLMRAELSAERLVQMMVGRPLAEFFERQSFCDRSRVRLEVSGITDGEVGRVEPASFTLYAGEVLGLSGLVGAGRTELARLIFGADPMAGGSVKLDGMPLNVREPLDAIRAGIAYVPEDRKTQGLFLDLASLLNVSITTAERDATRGFWLNRAGADALFERYREALAIRVARPQLESRHLSGGNQQKLLLARWAATKPSVLILDEPTRGVDVGAKHDIYHMMHELAAQGVAVLMISSDLPEIVGLCDRVLVMREGELVGEVGGDAPGAPAITQENIMAFATGSHAMAQAA